MSAPNAGLSRHDKVSPPSVIGGVGLITDNGSNGFGVFDPAEYRLTLP
jgi:hypothetical protein